MKREARPGPAPDYYTVSKDAKVASNDWDRVIDFGATCETASACAAADNIVLSFARGMTYEQTTPREPGRRPTPLPLP